MTAGDTANYAANWVGTVTYYWPVAAAAIVPFAKKLFNAATADLQALLTKQNQLLDDLLNIANKGKVS